MKPIRFRLAGAIVPVLSVILVLSNVRLLSAQDMSVDYSYPPPRWNTPIGLPGDWHKPMVNEDGALVYDFGPGPYAIPGTAISFGVVGDSMAMQNQTIVDPRVPIVRTEIAGQKSDVVMEAFSVVPRHDWQHDDEQYVGSVRRINGTNGMIGWANPPGDVDPAFRNVAYGTNRPIDYKIRVEPGSRRRVILGLADPYRKKDHWIKRVMVLNVDGADPHVIDVVDRVGQNTPTVVAFDAHDVDSDGFLDIRIEAKRETIDGNLFLNVIWVFPAGTIVDEEALIRGELSAEAEYYIDCGRDPQIQARGPRLDVLSARYSEAVDRPVIRVQTTRPLVFDTASGILTMFGDPFLVADPLPIDAEQTENGWELVLPAGTRQASAAIWHAGQSFDWQAAVPDIDLERERLAKYWREESGLPWDKITVSDPGVQDLFDGSIRTMYQLTERIDGDLQSQPGPSVYRGLWVSNQPRVGRALTHLGDFKTARESFKRTFTFQQESGQIVVLTPPILLKETGTAVHTIYQHARMTRDRAFLESYWPALERAAEWIAMSRRQTTDPEALNYGLMPAGFSDGGIGGIVPEYTSVNWNVLAIKGLAEGAQWLGRHEDAARHRAELSDFQAAFRRAAARDVRQDDHGNWFLPIRMEWEEGHVPQRSQTQFAYMVYPGRLFDKDDPLVEGNMKMLADAHKEEGLVVTTGWLDDGLQPFIESTRAGVRVYLGEVEMAQEVMYAIANHAAPTHVWIEEQLPGSGPRRATGDVPHSSACSEWINMVRYFLAIEDGAYLDLLKAVPAQWIYPGAVIRADDIPTEFGDLTLHLEISGDGTSASIRVSPIVSEETVGGVRIHLGALKAHGFTLLDGSALPDVWGGEWGREVVIEMKRGS